MDQIVKSKVAEWLSGNYDEQTKNEIRKMMSDDPETINDAFYRNLEFGTGGMRGKMGPGTNRMNKYTVGMATQGLCNYLKMMYPGVQRIKVAVSYDNRINSRYFAETVSDVFSANDIFVYLFDSLRPTPELSFAIRHLGCQSGVMVTASHNPREYNGYKVYWDDGAQLIPPHDKNVITEVEKISGIGQVNFRGKKELVAAIGEEIDRAFLEKMKSLPVLQGTVSEKNIRIIYTPLHGTGGRLVPKALNLCGFQHVFPVTEQMVEDGHFPTAKSPNPEEPVALEMALKKAAELNGDLILANDPDADRVGIAVKDHHGSYLLLNGNQTGAIMTEYVLRKLHNSGKIQNNDYIVTTIVTSGLIREIAEHYHVKAYEVLTGFKWIGGVIRELEGKENFILGLEESYGYLAGDFVRDKDAVSASVVIAEMAAEAGAEGNSLLDRLIDVYIKYGFYKEELISVNKEGQSGAKEIEKMMEDFRNNPPEKIAGSKVIKISDYLLLKEKDIPGRTINEIRLPKSNVLQFYTEDGSKISARPSGTEPKIKFYFSVKEKLADRSDYEKVSALLDARIYSIIKDLGLR